MDLLASEETKLSETSTEEKKENTEPIQSEITIESLSIKIEEKKEEKKR